MRTVSRNILRFTLIALVAALVKSCGSAGVRNGDECGLCGDTSDLTGSISSQTNGQQAMKGWVVVMVERDTNIARVSEVDAAGIYSLRKVRTGKPQTMLLLSPDYIGQAVLSLPAENASTPAIRQFFYPQNSTLPKLIHAGQIIQFQDLTGIKPTSDLAADSDLDKVPEGASSFGLASVPDSDQDGTPNDVDPDIDGDGVINIFDSDNDNDQTLDVLDGDANDDLVNDEDDGNVGDQYFSEGVEYIAVEWVKKPKSTGSGTTTTLRFTTKVRDNVSPSAVQIRGAPKTLNNAKVLTVDADDNPTTTAWNRLLGDDGLTDDNSADDRVFAVTVELDSGKSPRSNEAVFFQLRFGTDANPYYVEYPFTFPNLTTGDISAQYESVSRNVILVSESGKSPPFGTVKDYTWSVNVWNEEGSSLIYYSGPISGNTSTFNIPANQLVSGTSYKWEVVAQSLGKVNKIYPTYKIHSEQYDLTVP